MHRFCDSTAASELRPLRPVCVCVCVCVRLSNALSSLPFLRQGHSGGALRIRLRAGHPVLGQQGPPALPDRRRRRRRPAEAPGLEGDLQRAGAAGGAAFPGTQPASAVLLPAGPEPHGALHLEEAALRRRADHHHALLVRTGLLLLPGEGQTTVMHCWFRTGLRPPQVRWSHFGDIQGV